MFDCVPNFSQKETPPQMFDCVSKMPLLPVKKKEANYLI